MTVLPLWRRSRRDAVAPAEPVALRPRETFVFSGGGSLGAAQVGALQALFEAGITPDAVVGTSVGALNAAYIAIDPSPERAADFAESAGTAARPDSGREDGAACCYVHLGAAEGPG